MDITLLLKELAEAGLPIVAIDKIDGQPRARWSRDLTPEEIATAQAVRDAHNSDAYHTAVNQQRQQIRTALQSVVGKGYVDLTTAEIKLLMLALLYLQNAIDPQTLEIKPISEWLK